MTEIPSDDHRLAEERQFWDHHVLPLEYCVKEYRAGPDLNTLAVLEALEPLEGRRVLDFACGAGVLTAWLADRGADVTGVDLSEGAVERARELVDLLGIKARFVADDVSQILCDEESAFDRVAGRYALHHVDPVAIAPLLGACLAPDGRAAFVETMATNPILRWSRAHLVGRAGVPRLGTLDEAPLTQGDVDALAASLGACDMCIGEMTFLRILDRQILRFRSGAASRILGGIDDLLGRSDRLRSLSYKQVLIFDRTRESFPMSA